MSSLWKLILVVGLVLVFLPPAVASDPRSDRRPGDTDEDEDEDEESGLTGKTTKVRAQADKPVVEVARGIFVQTDPGSFDYLGFIQLSPDYPPFGRGVFWGHSMRLHAGVDMVTSGRFGLSAQATFWQVVNKGRSPDEGFVSQGATRSFLYEAALRPTLRLGSARRLNVYARAGAGVGFLQQARSDVPAPGAIYSSFAHGLVPKPFMSGGGGVEYYTRLSHFSFTFLEINALYLPGFDVAVAINFAGFKYTF